MLKPYFLIFLIFCSCNKFIVSGEPFDKDEYILGSDDSQSEQLDELDEIETQKKSL